MRALVVLLSVGCGTSNTDFVSVEAGASHACGLKSDGTLTCWGGVGGSAAPSGTYDHLSVGYQTSCVGASGALECFGGEEPEEIEVPEGTFPIAAPGRSASCALDDAGEIHCWGAAPEGIPPGPFTHLVGGASVFAALDSSGSVETFGSLAVPGPTEVMNSLAAGYREVCGLTTEGAIRCWADVVVDDGDAAPTLETPEGTGFTHVAAGYGHGCALDGAGDAVCWGTGAGAESIPYGPFTDIAAGGELTCAVREDTSVSCWGAIGEP